MEYFKDLKFLYFNSLLINLESVNNSKMKIFFMIFLTLFLNESFCKLLNQGVKLTQAKNPKKDRKLYENLTTSYILGDTVDATDTSHLSLLVA